MNGWSHGMGTRAMPPRLSLSPYTFGQGDADCSQPPSILFSSSPPDSFSSISTTFQRRHECTLMPFFSLGGQLFLLDSQLAAIKLLPTFLNIHRLLSLLPSFGDQQGVRATYDEHKLETGSGVDSGFTQFWRECRSWRFDTTRRPNDGGPVVTSASPGLLSWGMELFKQSQVLGIFCHWMYLSTIFWAKYLG